MKAQGLEWLSLQHSLLDLLLLTPCKAHGELSFDQDAEPLPAAACTAKADIGSAILRAVADGADPR